MSDTYFLTLLRHGESEGNAAGRWQGQQDSPLTEHGRAQARALAERWEGEQRMFDRVFSSPLSRAYDTAQIVADRLDLAVETDPIWMERDNGVFAGTTRDSRPYNGPKHFYEPIGVHGESLSELYVRAGTALHTIIRQGAGRYLVVSHGGILNQALCYAVGIQPQPVSAGVRFDFWNTGFASLEFFPERNLWRVRGVNDIRHLVESGPQDGWQG